MDLDGAGCWSPGRRRGSAPRWRRCSRREAPPSGWWPGGPTGSTQVLLAVPRSTPGVPDAGRRPVRPRRRRARRARGVGRVRRPRRARQQRRPSPKRKPVTDLTPTRSSDTMRVNFLSPARMTLAVLPGMLERDSGVHRERRRASAAGSASSSEAAYSRIEVRAVRLVRSAWPSTSGTPVSRSASSSPAPSTPRSGTSPTTTRPLRRAARTAGGGRRRDRRRHRGRPLRALPARPEGRDRVQDGRHRRVHRRAGRLAQTDGGSDEGAPFLTDPEPWPTPLPDDAADCCGTSATTPMALVDLRRPDAARATTGSCCDPADAASAGPTPSRS